MPTCKHCHRFKKKSYLKRHEKICSPTAEDVDHLRVSRIAKHTDKYKGVK